MKKTILFIMIYLFISSLCAQTDIYVAGLTQDSGASFYYAKIYKNGEEFASINDDEHNIEVHGILLSEKDFYAAGISHNSFCEDATVWKNGVEFYSLPNAYYRRIAIEGNDVYMAGHEIFDCPSPWATAKVWKNGEELYAMSGPTWRAFVQDMCIVNGDIYVSGEEGAGEVGSPMYYAASVWKNGELLYKLANNESFANAVFVDGEDVYVGGEEYFASNYVVGRIWKNGVPIYTIDNITHFANIKDIFVLEGDVYAVGSIGDVGAHTVGKLWKNGEELYTFRVSENSFAEFMFLEIINGDIYVAVSFGNGLSRIYKNGAILYEYPHYFLTAMYIDTHGVGITAHEVKAAVKVYPNPASEYITIELPLTENGERNTENGAWRTENGNAIFTLCDIQGRELLRQPIGNKETINVSRFVSGIYIYTVEVGGRKTNGKLVIN